MKVILFEKEEEEFFFVDIPERPIPSLLCNYSAPVRLVSDITNDDLYFLLTHDIYVCLKNEAYENF